MDETSEVGATWAGAASAFVGRAVRRERVVSGARVRCVSEQGQVCIRAISSKKFSSKKLRLTLR